MHRAIVRTVVCLGALGIFGCDDMGRYDAHQMGAYGHDRCRAYASCDTCTPVLGCGWCSWAPGQGVCLPSPDQCGAAQFTWTWEPVGCRAGAEAGPTSNDAADESGVDAARPDASGTVDSAADTEGADAATD